MLDKRKDIEGLRALAIMAVLAFHYQEDVFTSGYLGVDVFFILSGYLITQILCELHKKSPLTLPLLASFYARRIRRVVPALFIMILVLLLAGYWVLLPDDYISTALSAVHAARFSSNHHFAGISGYFAYWPYPMPLQHTWSLAVEAQFYLAWPFCLGLFLYLHKKCPAVSWLYLLLLGALSYWFMLFLEQHDYTMGFYGAPSRLWQFLLGATAWLITDSAILPLPRRTCAITALAMLLVIIFFLLPFEQTGTLKPYNRMLVSLSTAILLFCAGRHPSMRALWPLTCAPAQVLGRYSYGLYLWHLPLFHLAYVYLGHFPESSWQWSAVICITAVLSLCSYHLVERPCRTATATPGRVIAMAVLASLLLQGMAYGISQKQGFPSRVNTSLAPATTLFEVACPKSVIEESYSTWQSICVAGTEWKTSSSRMLLWGDSHGGHILRLLEAVAAKAGVSVFAPTYKCPPFYEPSMGRLNEQYGGYYSHCVKEVNDTLEWLGAHPEVHTIILTAAWSGYSTLSNKPDATAEDNLAAMRTALELLMNRLKGRRIILISDVPRPNRDLKKCLLMENSQLLHRPCTEDPHDIHADYVAFNQGPTNTMLKDVAAKLRARGMDITFINSTEAFCGSKTCPTIVNNELIYLDGNHLRRDLKPETYGILARMLGLETLIAKH